MECKIAYILITFSFFIISCQKDKTHPYNGYHNSPQELPQIPYDSANLFGTFIGVNNGNQYSDIFAKLYSSLENGRAEISITDDTSIGYYALAFNNCYFLLDNRDLLSKGITTWRISDSIWSFTYSDTSRPPAVQMLSDTITHNMDTALLRTAFTNTDSVGVMINNVQYYYPPKDTLAINLPAYGIVAKQPQDIMITISAYKHGYLIISGRNYLFIKERQLQQSIWLR